MVISGVTSRIAVAIVSTRIRGLIPPSDSYP